MNDFTNVAERTLTTTETTTEGGIDVSITNNLSVAVDIFDVFNSATTDTVVPYTYTKLGTIAAGATGTITTIRNVAMLEAMTTGNIAEINNNYFYQFPIKFMSGTQFSFGTPAPLAYTIEEEDRTSMIQSFLFHKFAMANPDSALTKNLNSAIAKGDSDSINSFFAGTKNFQSCTLSSWNAVMTWLQMFTSGWQGPYYLYENAPSPLPSGYVPVLIATLNIVSTEQANSATLSMCTEDSKGNPVYPSPAQNTTVVMNGDGTMGDENPGTDTPVTLTPVWMNVIQTTMKDGVPQSSYLAGPAVTGTVANNKVVSSQTARQLPDKPADANTSASFDSIFGKLCQTVGLIVGLVMLYEIIEKKMSSKSAAEEKAKSEAKSEDDLNSEVTSIDESTSKEIAAESAKLEPSMSEDASSVADSYAQTSQEMQKETMTESMNDSATKIEAEITTQLENGATPTQDFENAFSDMQTSFKEVESSIESGDFTSAGKTLSEASTNIESAINKESAEMHEWESSSLQDSADTLKDAAQQSEILEEAQTEYEESMEKASEDSGFNEDSQEPEVDPIEAEF